MRAVLLFRDRRVEAGGIILEMTIRRVPIPVPPSTHDLKYSLVYARPGERIVGFDNERGKDGHIHIRDEERSYTFTSVERLVADFLTEMRNAGGGS